MDRAVFPLLRPQFKFHITVINPLCAVRTTPDRNTIIFSVDAMPSIDNLLLWHSFKNAKSSEKNVHDKIILFLILSIKFARKGQNAECDVCAHLICLLEFNIMDYAKKKNLRFYEIS